ncbi:MAG: hypothetical protein WKF59_03295 [Chitinophagaceae bacterium]
MIEFTKLQQYLQRKPSKIWLACDTFYNLYKQFAFSFVGQSAILDRNRKIIALVNTNSINAILINRLIAGDSIKSNAKVTTSVAAEGIDPFGVDSSSIFSVALWPSMPSMSSKSQEYLNIISSVYAYILTFNLVKQIIRKIDNRKKGNKESSQNN